MLTIGKGIFSGFPARFSFAYLFFIGKPAVKRGFASPCYPRGMEIFLVATIAAMIIVVIIDTEQKRRASLCQQVKVIRRK